MRLSEFLGDHRAREHFCALTQLVCRLLQHHRRLYHILGRYSVELILHRFPNFDHFLEPAAQVFNLKMRASDGTLILLGVIIISIDALVVLEV
jgi:hypothetical protein